MPSLNRTRSRGSRKPPAKATAEVRAVWYRDQITRQARRSLAGTLGWERAGDVAADVFIWFMERRAQTPGYLDAPGEFRTRIQHKLLEELRKATTDIEKWDESQNIDEIAADGARGGIRRLRTPEELYLQWEVVWYVQEAIAQLPPRMQEVVNLCDIDGWSAEETAAELGLTPGNVRKIRFEARKKLRPLLSEFANQAA